MRTHNRTNTPMSRVFGILAGLCLAASASMSQAEVARIEVHPIASKTLSDTQFLGEQADGNPVTIAGELRIPVESKDQHKQPVVVLLHGSSGYLGYVQQWVEFLNGMGIATFTLDSLSGRNLRRVGESQGDLGRLASTYDAYRALDLLASDARFDKERIVLMGFSRGGQAALYAAVERFQAKHGTPGNGFAGYIAFYPNCVTRYLTDDKVAGKPIRVFHGMADDYNPVGACSAYVERLVAAGADASLAAYPNAHHVFDWDKFEKPIQNPKAQTARNCKLSEVSPGRIVNTQSGKDFSYEDPCVEHGITVAYSAEAAKAAREAVRDLLTRWFGN